MFGGWVNNLELYLTYKAGCDGLSILIHFCLGQHWHFWWLVLHWLFHRLRMCGLAFGPHGLRWDLGAHDPVARLLIWLIGVSLPLYNMGCFCTGKSGINFKLGNKQETLDWPGNRYQGPCCVFIGASSRTQQPIPGKERWYYSNCIQFTLTSNRHFSFLLTFISPNSLVLTDFPKH